MNIAQNFTKELLNELKNPSPLELLEFLQDIGTLDRISMRNYLVEKEYYSLLSRQELSIREIALKLAKKYSMCERNVYNIVNNKKLQ